ncbi:ABC transporter permease [Taklimakanibacter deserti]|uniref:ABC transporter permease n=1 Tax=Taklimakanibacter deserti TaxID=2267839 RepID=UPI000E64BA6C
MAGAESAHTAAKPKGERAQGAFVAWLMARFERERRGVWILIALILAYMAWANPNFYGRGNIAAVLNDAAILGIGAAGMTILIMAGAFDLSVTAIMGLAPLVALIYFGDMPGPVMVLVSVLAGALCGLVNGLIVTRGRVVPFVATLGTLFAFTSIAYIISNGTSVYVSNAFVMDLAGGRLFDVIPYSFVIMLVVFLLCHLFLRHLHIGRWIRAAGSNLRAAHVSGIDLRRVYLLLFVMSGVLTGLAGILLTGYLASAIATQATNYNLNAIAAVVVGGTALAGGRGTLLGTAAAALLFAMVNNALILLGVSSYYQYLATGIILILALVLGLIGFGGRLPIRDS